MCLRYVKHSGKLNPLNCDFLQRHPIRNRKWYCAAVAAILKIEKTSSLCRGDPILMKFGNPMQNEMPMTLVWSKSKPEEVHYGGPLSFQTVSSHISAVDSVISTN